MPPSLAALANAKALERQEAQLAEKTEMELQIEVLGDLILDMKGQLDTLSKGREPNHPRVKRNT